MIRQYELVDMIKTYDPGMNEDMVNRAYVYAMKMHGAQTRASGDPYFSHPLEVAGILTEMKMDTAPQFDPPVGEPLTSPPGAAAAVERQ